MNQAILQIVCGVLGTFAFALFFHVAPRHLVLATVGGGLSWLLYLLVFAQGNGVFLSALAASFGICLWSEIMARVRKAPTNIFLIPGIIPPAARRVPVLHHERPHQRGHGHRDPAGEGDRPHGAGHRGGHPHCLGDCPPLLLGGGPTPAAPAPAGSPVRPHRGRRKLTCQKILFWPCEKGQFPV